ncbi:tRNA (adenosine(37)-N6)-dimethylallyltransferase MiaA [Sulfurospirillum deleyianum]|uniref:tRNA dimethylallyltransferase n=1 Tax=Sulfurospirillum deleyianum (strain ATCC 51133 / DSM 6946 / 5175) TaxID=525898 RepID=D1AZ53_SULD5|nr:tRNA (adenosine(37)-N6)-dimethylallyltransferase MiaA [Sulfurospirillum deleyianum]ACZ11191.1 tRNA delta(2)-isopentenylpyrophosphate transferase [Sulfurospirillum deleyianum DSM 6946]
MKTIAILGATASGKTALAIELAHKHSAYILSLDSLSIYTEIDIASAKPSLEERQGIAHFGMDVLLPNEHFDVTMFFDLYKDAKEACEKDQKHLIIVGGTGFYLKAMMEGFSVKPEISLHVKEKVEESLLDLTSAYALIQRKDPTFASKIALNDRYRIEKWLEIFYATDEVPSDYLANTKQAPLICEVPLFEIETPKEILAQRIALRTQKMLQMGLIEEVFGLEKKYTRTPQCMKAIGIKEVLDYFDGRYTLGLLEERITLNTLHLAKRQRTFNASQFPIHPKIEIERLKPLIANTFYM